MTDTGHTVITRNADSSAAGAVHPASSSVRPAPPSLGRRLLAVIVLGVAVAATGLTVPAAAIPPGSAPVCSAGQLRPAFVSGEAATGHLYATYRFTNVGGVCQTRGWVGAELFGADGRPLPTRPSRVGGPPTTVTLAQNATASWTFGYVNPGVLDCHPPASPTLIITPPDNTTPVLVNPGFSPCYGWFTVTPLRVGS